MMLKHCEFHISWNYKVQKQMTNEGSSNKIFRMIHTHIYIYTCTFKNKRIDKKLRYRYIVNFIFNNNNTRCASILKKLSKCFRKELFLECEANYESFNRSYPRATKHRFRYKQYYSTYVRKFVCKSRAQRQMGQSISRRRGITMSG